MQIEEVASNTYRIETPVPGTGLIFSVYLINTDGGVLIEPGPSAAIPLIREGMKQVGMHDLSWIIPTHIHMDHGGGTGTLAEMFPKSKVIAHTSSARHIIDPSRLIQSTQMSYGEDFKDTYGPILPVLQSQVVVPDDGKIILCGDNELQIIYTPGHAPHHIAIFDRKTGSLFCGESLGMETDDPLPAAAAPSFDIEDCLETMNRLKSLQSQLLCYSHGGVRPNPETRISQVIENTKFYGDLVLESLNNGQSPQEISQKVEERACAQFTPKWEGDMIRVWRTGIIEGYTLYFKSKGMA